MSRESWNSHSFTIQLYQRPYSYTLFCCTQLMLSLVRVQIRIYPPYSYANDRIGVQSLVILTDVLSEFKLTLILDWYSYRKDRTAIHSLVILSLADWSLVILTDVSSEFKLTLIHHPVTPYTVTIQTDGLWSYTQLPSCLFTDQTHRWALTALLWDLFTRAWLRSWACTVTGSDYL